jgi:hypothetical protein
VAQAASFFHLTDLSVERVGSTVEELRKDGFITIDEKDEDELEIDIDGLLDFDPIARYKRKESNCSRPLAPLKAYSK